MLPFSCAANAPQDRDDAKERAEVKRPRYRRSLRGSVALKVPYGHPGRLFSAADRSIFLSAGFLLLSSHNDGSLLRSVEFSTHDRR